MQIKLKLKFSGFYRFNNSHKHVKSLLIKWKGQGQTTNINYFSKICNDFIQNAKMYLNLNYNAN